MRADSVTSCLRVHTSKSKAKLDITMLNNNQVDNNNTVVGKCSLQFWGMKDKDGIKIREAEGEV